MPRSRTNPQFNGDSLPETLAPWQIGYEHIAALGGLRGKARGVEPSPNAYWRVRSFRNYADYALTKPFAVGLARLQELGEPAPVRNHVRRGRLVALSSAHHHRLPAQPRRARDAHPWAAHVDEASLTPGAVLCGDGTIIYPAESSQLE